MHNETGGGCRCHRREGGALLPLRRRNQGAGLPIRNSHPDDRSQPIAVPPALPVSRRWQVEAAEIRPISPWANSPGSTDMSEAEHREFRFRSACCACRMHGGKSTGAPRGELHPSYLHGRWTIALRSGAGQRIAATTIAAPGATREQLLRRTVDTARSGRGTCPSILLLRCGQYCVVRSCTCFTRLGSRTRV